MSGQPRPIPVNALDRAVAAEREQLHAAVGRVIDSGWFVLGPETEAFEHELAEQCGVGNCIGVANGTDALQLALTAVGVTAGDAVATVANAGMYTSTAALQLGARPLFVDVDPDHLLMDPAALATTLERSSERVAAVVVTHLYGQMADVATIVDICAPRGIPVVEDCAQAVGTRIGDRSAGATGTVGTFSFYPTKNLGALGDGGAVVTDDADLAARVRRLRQYGWDRKYHAVTAGGRNSRLDEIQAAVLRMRLPATAAGNAARRAVLARYRDALAGGARRMVLRALDESHSGHLAVLRTATRDTDRAQLSAAGIATDIHYPVPDHKQPVLADRASESLPVTEAAAAEILTLPCFPQLTDDEVDRVCAALRALP